MKKAGVVLAAGYGSRFWKSLGVEQESGMPKVMINYRGVDLSTNHILGMGQYVDELIFVLGFKATPAMERISEEHPLHAPHFAVNREYGSTGTGMSLRRGLDLAEELGCGVVHHVAGDHLIPYRTMGERVREAEELLEEFDSVVLADRGYASPLSQTSHLELDGRRVRKIYRGTDRPDALDAGYFISRTDVLSRQLNAVLEEDRAAGASRALNRIASEGRLGYVFLDLPWFPINTAGELFHAVENLDGRHFYSRYRAKL